MVGFQVLIHCTNPALEKKHIARQPFITMLFFNHFGLLLNAISAFGFSVRSICFIIMIDHEPKCT